MSALTDIMSTAVTTMPRDASVQSAAQAMREQGIGDVVITDPGGSPIGIVSDRDIVVGAVAAGADPSQCTLGEVSSGSLITASPHDTPESVIELMAKHAIRRVPVCDGDELIGMISLGDLAVHRDPDSLLATISGAPTNN